MRKKKNSDKEIIDSEEEGHNDKQKTTTIRTKFGRSTQREAKKQKEEKKERKETKTSREIKEKERE